ncbi:MAG TPA: hypothetical protein PKC42_03630 [Candidatus Nanoperiomorbaceae bacterium]|nr:hypothetical protein [Candidatus Nanoperiomorbaceae bacterium]
MVGGYKQARLSSAPHIDWAEVFNVRHMLRLACELAARYESGVELVWRFHTSILSQINNYSLSDFEVYAQEFDRLLAHYAQCLGDIPITMRIEYAGNPREGESYVGQLEPQLEQYERWFDGLGEHEQAQLIAKSWRNIKWEGREQWAGLNEHEKYDKAKRALLLDKAFLDNDPITSTPTCETGITIYSRAGGAHDRLQYGGCSASSVQFWAGEGVFEVRTERVVPVIMPYSSNTRIVREQIAIPDTTSIAPTLTHVFWYQDTGYTK